MDQRALPSIKNSKIFKITSALFRLQNNELFMHRLTGQNKFTDGFSKKKFQNFEENFQNSKFKSIKLFLGITYAA